MMLPRRHSASRTSQFRQKPEDVFEAIRNWRDFPSWRPELTDVRQRQGESGRESWVEVSKMGEMALEIVESDPPRKLVGKIADPHRKLPFGGTWTYLIEPAADGCTLTITEDGEIYPPLFRFMARFIFGYTRTMEQYMKALGRKFSEDVAVR
jgi:hypothetical protein